MPSALDRPDRQDLALDLGNYRLASQTVRRIGRLEAGSIVRRAQTRLRAEEQIEAIRAVNAVTAAAAELDTMLGQRLAALPVTDATDADFRAQLRHIARSKDIALLLDFRP